MVQLTHVGRWIVPDQRPGEVLERTGLSQATGGVIGPGQQTPRVYGTRNLDDVGQYKLGPVMCFEIPIVLKLTQW